MRISPLRVTVTIEDAEISWDEVRESVRVLPDEDMGAPWENDDGWAHTADKVGARYLPADDKERSIRYVSRTTREGGDVWLTIDPEEMGLPTWKYYHAAGASRQVAHELAAMDLRRAYGQLAEWYANGWQYWRVMAKLKDCSAACGGIDDEAYACGEMSDEVAHELAAELTAAGYVVTDIPQPQPQPKHYRIPGGVNRFNVSRR
jgi:hypothetical protein